MNWGSMKSFTPRVDLQSQKERPILSCCHVCIAETFWLCASDLVKSPQVRTSQNLFLAFAWFLACRKRCVESVQIHSRVSQAMEHKLFGTSRFRPSHGQLWVVLLNPSLVLTSQTNMHDIGASASATFLFLQSSRTTSFL